MKRIISILISVMLVAGIFTSLPTGAFAATKKVVLKKASATLKITEKKGKTAFGKTTIKVKKAKGVTVKKVTFKSANKKTASVSKKGDVTAKAGGETKITVKVKYTFKKRAFKKNLTFKVKVVDKRKTDIGTPATFNPTETATEATETTGVTEATETTGVTEATEATEKPTESETVSETASEQPESAAQQITGETGTEAYTNVPASETTSPFVTTEDYDPSSVPTLVPTNEPSDPYNDIQGDTNHCEEYGSELYSGHQFVTHDFEAEGYTGETYPLTYPWGETIPESELYKYIGSETEPTENQGTTDHCVVEPSSEPVSAPVDPTVTAETKPATSIDPQTFEQKLSAFSNKLYKMCDTCKEQNYVMSPLSVYMALSMLYNVSDDAVKKELEDFVGMSESDFKKTAELYNNLISEYTVWEAEDIYDYHSEEVKKVVGKLSLSNSIWIDDNLKINEEELKKFQDDLICEARKTTFKDDNDAANEEIRKFVKEKTNGLIDQNFGLKPETLFALVNTLYFKDIWDSELSNRLVIVKREFNTGSSSQKCDFLRGLYVSGQAYENDTTRFFYSRTEHGYKIKFFVPKDGYSLEDVMTVSNIYELNNIKDFKTEDDEAIHKTRCIFPKFKIDSNTPLGTIIQSSGVLKNAFNSFESPLVPDKDLAVSEIIHRTVVDVTEYGVEGAAVTVIALCEAAAMPDEKKIIYHDFVVDKNFGFVITDYNDTILFEGRVSNPTA